MEKQQRIKEIDKEIILVSLIDAPGTIMVALGLYAKFAANGNAFWSALNNPSVVNAMLAVGGAIMTWGIFKVFSLSRERARLQAHERS